MAQREEEQLQELLLIIRQQLTELRQAKERQSANTASARTLLLRQLQIERAKRQVQELQAELNEAPVLARANVAGDHHVLTSCTGQQILHRRANDFSRPLSETLQLARWPPAEFISLAAINQRSFSSKIINQRSYWL